MLITKYGNVVAEVKEPYDVKPEVRVAGFAQGQKKSLGDIVEPINIEGEAMQ